MSKVSYANMKLKVNNEIKTFDFNGNEIEVLSYLPIEDKFDLVISDDLYGEKTWELAVSKMVQTALDMSVKKVNKNLEDVDFLFA